MILIKGRGPDVRLGGTVWYTVRLRLRVTKQRTQRGGKLLISNHDRHRADMGPPALGSLLQNNAAGQERYCSLSLPDMMSK